MPDLYRHFKKRFWDCQTSPNPRKIPFSLLNVIKTFPMPLDRAWKKMKPPSSSASSSSSSSSSEECRNWLELPRDVTVSILQRLGTIEILETAQKVCMLWRNISKDPSMWNSIDMRNLGDLHDMDYDLEKMCIHAIDRSCGHLQDINIEYFGTDKLLAYITQRYLFFFHYPLFIWLLSLLIVVWILFIFCLCIFSLLLSPFNWVNCWFCFDNHAKCIEIVVA